MNRVMSRAAVLALAALASAAHVRAEDLAAKGPAIIETGPEGARTLLQCAADQMPMATRGPTLEVQDGKVARYDHGVLKCVGFSGKARTGEAGGAGSVGLGDGRKLEVVNCPGGATPFVMALEHVTEPFKLSPDRPLPKGYMAAAPVVVGCVETALMSPSR